MNNLYDISDFVNVRTPEKTIYDLVLRFKERRKEAGFSQRELSKRTGVSYASIRRFETKGEISFHSLILLANALDLLDDFYKVFDTPIVKDIRGDD